MTSGFIFDHISTWMHVATVSDVLTESLNIDLGDGLWEGQLTSHENWHANLISGNVRIRRDHRSTTKVDSLAHHFHPEHALLLLKELSYALLCLVSGLLCHV